MIHEISTLPGRVRFRSREFYGNKLLARYINTYMEGLYGVSYSSINHNTGSILIVYDIEKTNSELLAENIQIAITSIDNLRKEKIKQHGLYYKTIEKRDKAKLKFLSFGFLYLLLKLKHSVFGKFSVGANVAVLEVASAVTIIGGYPLLKKFYKRFSKNLPTDADILLNLTAISFTILRESSKGVFVLILKNLSDYIKYSSEVECIRALNAGMGKTSGMAWLILGEKQEVLVPINTLSIGDIVYVHKGEVSPA